MFSYVPEPINLSAVFGFVFASYLLFNLEQLARTGLAFVKGVFK